MSTSSPDDIPKQIEELQRLQSQIRVWRTVSVLVVIATVVICVGMISQYFTRLVQPGPAQKEFTDALMQGVKTDVLPSVRRIAGQTVNDIMPIVDRELNKLNDRAPEIAEAARKELAVLSKNLPNKAEKALQKTFGDMLKQREARIRQTYPDVTEAKVAAFVNNLVTVSEERVDQLAHTLFADHILSLNKITENLHTIYTLEEPNIANEVPNWEMALVFFDVIREEIRPLETSTTK